MIITNDLAGEKRSVSFCQNSELFALFVVVEYEKERIATGKKGFI